MKQIGILGGSIVVSLALIYLLPFLLNQTSGTGQFTALLTAGAGFVVAGTMWWWTISEFMYSYANRRENTHLLKMISRFATPRVRRAATIALAVPTFAFATQPAFAGPSSSDSPSSDLTINLTWGSETTPAQPEPAQPTVVAQEEPTQPSLADQPQPAQPHLATQPEPAQPHLAAEPAVESQHSVVVPSAEAQPAPANDTTAPAPTPAHRDATWHTVQRGDTLWSIAASHAPDEGAIPALVESIWQANRIVIGTNPNLILPGQELYIP